MSYFSSFSTLSFFHLRGLRHRHFDFQFVVFSSILTFPFFVAFDVVDFYSSFPTSYFICKNLGISDAADLRCRFFVASVVVFSSLSTSSCFHRFRRRRFFVNFNVLVFRHFRSRVLSLSVSPIFRRQKKTSKAKKLAMSKATETRQRRKRRKKRRQKRRKDVKGPMHCTHRFSNTVFWGINGLP